MFVHVQPPLFFFEIDLFCCALGGGWDSIRYAKYSLRFVNLSLFVSQEVVGGGGGSACKSSTAAFWYSFVMYTHSRTTLRSDFI